MDEQNQNTGADQEAPKEPTLEDELKEEGKEPENVEVGQGEGVDPGADNSDTPPAE